MDVAAFGEQLIALFKTCPRGWTAFARSAAMGGRSPGKSTLSLWFWLASPLARMASGSRSERRTLLMSTSVLLRGAMRARSSTSLSRLTIQGACLWMVCATDCTLSWGNSRLTGQNQLGVADRPDQLTGHGIVAGLHRDEAFVRPSDHPTTLPPYRRAAGQPRRQPSSAFRDTANCSIVRLTSPYMEPPVPWPKTVGASWRGRQYGQLRAVCGACCDVR